MLPIQILPNYSANLVKYLIRLRNKYKKNISLYVFLISYIKIRTIILLLYHMYANAAHDYLLVYICIQKSI